MKALLLFRDPEYCASKRRMYEWHKRLAVITRPKNREKGSLNSSVGVVTRLRKGQQFFIFFRASRPALWPSQSLLQRLQKVLFRG